METMKTHLSSYTLSLKTERNLSDKTIKAYSFDSNSLITWTLDK